MSLILTPSQAEAIHSAMWVLSAVHMRIDLLSHDGLMHIRENSDGRVIIARRRNRDQYELVREFHDSQSAFAEAYGLLAA